MAEILHIINNIRKDTASNWISVNPKLKLAEPVYEIDTGKLKFGNGVDFYEDLPYFTGENKEFTVNDQIGTLSGANTYNIVITAGDIKYNEVDTIVDKVSAVEDEVSLKESRLNKVDSFDKETANLIQYPSTKAVVDYISTVVSDIPDNPSNPGDCLPEVGDKTKDYTLQSIQGNIKWVENTSGSVQDVAALEQKVKDQQDEINDLKSNLKALQDKFDSLINLNEEEF